MRFPHADQLHLPGRCTHLIPGKLHPDGRRYLPTVALELTAAATCSPHGLRLGLVDRHHRLPPDAVGHSGTAQLVCALSTLQRQTSPYQRGFVPEAGWQSGQLSMAPDVLAQVQQVWTWEAHPDALATPMIYIELLLDVGHGALGLRTNLPAMEPLHPGDWIHLARSRIDLLGFEVCHV